MDVGVGDEATAIEVIDGAHLQTKEIEYSLKPSSSNIPELNGMVIPTNNCDEQRNTPCFFADTLDNLDRIGASELACASPRCTDNAGVMVEELTLRNYSSENLSALGTSINGDNMKTKQNKWQHLYQIAGGSRNGVSPEDAAHRINMGGMSTIWEDTGYIREYMDKKTLDRNCYETGDNLLSYVNKPTLSNNMSPSDNKTKILSKSGFSEFFVKNTLKGKGVTCRWPDREGLGAEVKHQTYPNNSGATKAVPGSLMTSIRENVEPPSHGIHKPLSELRPDAFHSGVSLRQWLKSRQKVNKVKSLFIFRQIVDNVNNSHSQGVALPDLRPSSFKLLPSNEVMYLGSSAQKESKKKLSDQEVILPENGRNGKRSLEQGSYSGVVEEEKKIKLGESTHVVGRWPQFPNRSAVKSANETNIGDGPQFSKNEINIKCSPTLKHMMHTDSRGLVSVLSKSPAISAIDQMEMKWYASPKELNGRSCTLSSNIYCLGVLLFELLCSFDSERAHAVAMLDLQHRILPPNFLSESPKEAGFCLWLLHPEPSSRPTIRDILQSEVINGIQDCCGNDFLTSNNHEDAESELLLHFLESLKEQKHKSSSKLAEEINFLEADIEEVERRQPKKLFSLSCSEKELFDARGHISSGAKSSLGVSSNIVSPLCKESWLRRNINQLESAYFSVRSNIQHSDNGVPAQNGKELLESREGWYQSYKVDERNKPKDRLGIFFNGLCKYARYSAFKVCGVLRNGDFNNSANVICSLSFDRDEDYFAAAGVSKKIKIYEYHALLDDSIDIHYPLIEMSNKSKLSCTCWNSYIRNYLSSTDYDGVVKLWDAGTGQEISQFIEHNRRAWSVDFSLLDPTKLASGSDDCSVKLWNINEKNSLCTIKNIANVCCVQFSRKSSHLIAFGSADYKTYCYDLRKVSTPWCILAGHNKAVSYVKFLDSETLISASTDNTIKLWDLTKTSTSGLSTNAGILTLQGHTNKKNFVGLSVADDGYIACGSETNEVFAYYKSLPMPITSHKFGSIDSISGKETDDDGGQFVSSVCWRQKSETVVAANSTGSIKLLQMI